MSNFPTKKLLIAGIPGMGKTRIGNHLQEKHNFVHIDMEINNNIEAIIQNCEIFINNLSAEKDVVLTWGFIPNNQQIEIVNNLVSRNFKPIWFDGNREAARREFIRRDSQFGTEYLSAQLAALALQVQRIEESKITELINWKIINTFNSRHNFRSLDDIVKEIY